MKIKLISFLLTLVITAQLISSQAQVIKPEGNLTFVSAEEIKQHEKQGGYYNEFWKYHIKLDDGAEIYIDYSIAHFGGLKDAVTSARLSLLDWKGKNYKAAREYNLDKLVFTEDDYKFFLNEERGIWFEGKLPDHHRIKFRTNKNGTHFDIDLEFSEIEKGFTWGDGKFKIGNDDLAGMYVQIPSAKINGFVALDYDTVSVSGSATMIQFHQTNVATRIFDKSFRYSKQDGDNYSGGYFLIPKDNQDEIVGFAYQSNKDSVFIKKPVYSIQILENEKFKDETVPSVLNICYQNNSCDRIEIKSIQEKITMLDELGGIKKMLAKRFLGGDIIELRGKAKLNSEEEVVFSSTILD